MSVTSTDLKFYASENMPSGDSGTVGGAIDITRRVLFEDSALANNPAASGGDGTLRYLSTNNADSGDTVTVYGRNAAGSLISEAKNVGNSGVVTTGTAVFERILWASLTAHDYDIKVNDSSGNNILTVESGVTGVLRPFIGVSSSPSADVTVYSKTFLKNTNAVNALLNTAFIENAGGIADYITFAIEDAIQDSGTSTNRLTAPAAGDVGAAGFNSATKTLASQTDAGTTDLGPGSGVGIWLCLNLSSGLAAQKSTYSISVSGETI